MTATSTIAQPEPLALDHPLVEYLIACYGILMTLEQVAELLARPTESLRVSMTVQRDTPQYARLRAARRKVGRRSYYDARVVARLIEP